jgi:hypothetical protein
LGCSLLTGSLLTASDESEDTADNDDDNDDDNNNDDDDNYAAVADLGAQVLSVVGADDNHVDAGGGGHGIRADALSLASDEARRMVDDGILIEVDNDRLGETEEQMLWEGIWKHYCLANGRGLQSVLRGYLDEADPNDVFLIQMSGSRTWQVGRRNIDAREERDRTIDGMDVRVLRD